MASLFYSSLDRGMRVHLKVKILYKQDDDDPKVFWSTAGDCGYDFQIGETYLVFANNEEGADYFFSSICMRTKRLSDAGNDLAYLYFYKTSPRLRPGWKDSPPATAGASSRTGSDLSSSRRSHSPITIRPFHSLCRIGRWRQVLVRRSARGQLRTIGLCERLPQDQPVVGKEKSCARQIFVLPKTGGQ
jgi:hypothetical protein